MMIDELTDSIVEAVEDNGIEISDDIYLKIQKLAEFIIKNSGHDDLDEENYDGDEDYFGDMDDFEEDTEVE